MWLLTVGPGCSTPISVAPEPLRDLGRLTRTAPNLPFVVDCSPLPPGQQWGAVEAYLYGAWLVHPLAEGGPWLVANDNGEWGGFLAVVDERGVNQQVLSRENVIALFLDATRLVVVTGLAHLGASRGQVLRFDRLSAHRFASPREWRLDRCPASAELLPDGGIRMPLYFDSDEYRWRDDHLEFEPSPSGTASRRSGP